MLNEWSDRDDDAPMYPRGAWVIVALLIAIAIWLAVK